MPRSSHADWEPAAGRPDPVELLEEQAVTRVPELVPIRYGRMSVSPFTFFRGAALLMSSDLSHTPDSGLKVQAVRRRAPVELRRVRLARARARVRPQRLRRDAPRPRGSGTSSASRQASRSRAARAASARPCAACCCSAACAAIVRRCGRFAGMGNLQVWYSMLSRDVLMQAMSGMKVGHRKEFQSRVEKATAKATTKDSMKAFAKLTTRVDGHLQIISDPPVIVRAVDLLPASEADDLQSRHAGPVRRVQSHAPGRPPAAARGLPLRRYRPQDRRRRLGRHALLDPAARGQHGRAGPAVPAVQGGTGLRARTLRRRERVRATTAVAWSRVSA